MFCERPDSEEQQRQSAFLIQIAAEIFSGGVYINYCLVAYISIKFFKIITPFKPLKQSP